MDEATSDPLRINSLAHSGTLPYEFSHACQSSMHIHHGRLMTRCIRGRGLVSGAKPGTHQVQQGKGHNDQADERVEGHPEAATELHQLCQTRN